MRFTKRIEHAISDGELFIEYQPVVECDRRVVGHEALVRWRHPRRGVVPPATFIPRIEHRPAIETLTWWMAETVARQAKAWLRAGECAAVSVNVSATRRCRCSRPIRSTN